MLQLESHVNVLRAECEECHAGEEWSVDTTLPTRREHARSGILKISCLSDRSMTNCCLVSGDVGVRRVGQINNLLVAGSTRVVIRQDRIVLSQSPVTGPALHREDQ